MRGMARNASTRRIMTASSVPPTNPAVAPYAVPMITEITVAMQRDRKRDAHAVQHAAEDITAGVVGAEKQRARRRLIHERLREDRDRIVRRQPRCERRDRVERDERDEGDHRGRMCGVARESSATRAREVPQRRAHSSDQRERAQPVKGEHLRGAHAGIRERIEQIRDDRPDYHERARNQHRGRHQCVVAARDGRRRHPAHPRPREDDLHEHGPAEQRAGTVSPARVMVGSSAFRKTWCSAIPRSETPFARAVTTNSSLHRIEHCRSLKARDAGARHQHERGDGKHQMPQMIDDALPTNCSSAR